MLDGGSIADDIYRPPGPWEGSLATCVIGSVAQCTDALVGSGVVCWIGIVTSSIKLCLLAQPSDSSVPAHASTAHRCGRGERDDAYLIASK
jgi:hypothetical protein